MKSFCFKLVKCLLPMPQEPWPFVQVAPSSPLIKQMSQLTPISFLRVEGCLRTVLQCCRLHIGGCCSWPLGGLASGRDCFLRVLLQTAPSLPSPRSQNHWPQEDLKVISSILLNLLQKSSHRVSLRFQFGVLGFFFFFGYCQFP